jgi:hypothetical protein
LPAQLVAMPRDAAALAGLADLAPTYHVTSASPPRKADLV